MIMNEVFPMRSRFDDVDISILLVKPETKPSAVLQLAHGMRGCKERFLPFMNYMAENGVACVANDHRGHGASVKTVADRGYMYSGGYPAVIEDMKMVTDQVHLMFPDTPIFLLGHSMGSLAVRTYLKSFDDSIEGVIISGSPSSSPMLSAGLLLAYIIKQFSDGHIRLKLSQQLVSSLYNRRFATEGPEAWICSNPQARKDFLNNPACRFDYTANAMHSLLNLMKETYSSEGWKMANPHLPVYFISGDEDPCMRGEANFHRSVAHLVEKGYDDVTSALYAGMRHEVLNEVNKESVWQDILDHIRLWTT